MEGTRVTRSGHNNILDLIFTNNHELITSIHIQPSKITDYKYIKCETSHKLSANEKEHIPNNVTNLSTYNYESANCKNIKACSKKINWPEVLAKHDSNKIPRDRKVLFKKKKKLNKELQKSNPPAKKKWIEKAIGEIDQKIVTHTKKKIL